MRRIKVLVMDVDGTLTDGKIYVDQYGEYMKAFNVKDGYAIKNILSQHGIWPVIITGRQSVIVENRCHELNISFLFQNVQDKLSILQNFLRVNKIKNDEVAYIGDDLNDLSCIEFVNGQNGVTGCPSDAIRDVMSHVNYICKRKGGNGAVREFIDWMLNRED